MSSLFPGNPGGLFEYLKQNNGVQTSSRYRVIIIPPNGSQQVFLCPLAQIPSKKPIPAIYGIEYNNNLFDFAIEGNWNSRKYFEDWQTIATIDANGLSGLGTGGTLVNRVGYFDDIKRDIKIEALSQTNEINYTILLKECIPLEILPAKFDAIEMNSVVRFSVNIFYTSYQYLPGQS
jgi:hypothetical protein